MAEGTRIAADGRRYRTDDVAQVNKDLAKDGKTTVKSAAQLAAEAGAPKPAAKPAPKPAAKVEPAKVEPPKVEAIKTEPAKPTVSFGTSDGPPPAPKEFKKPSKPATN